MPKTQSQRILLLKKNYTIWSIVFQNNFWRTNYFNSNMCTKSALYIVIKCEKNRVWKKNVLISRCAVETVKVAKKEQSKYYAFWNDHQKSLEQGSFDQTVHKIGPLHSDPKLRIPFRNCWLKIKNFFAVYCKVVNRSTSHQLQSRH